MPQPVARALRRLGQDISAARRMRRLSQEDLDRVVSYYDGVGYPVNVIKH